MLHTLNCFQDDSDLFEIVFNICSRKLWISFTSFLAETKFTVRRGLKFYHFSKILLIMEPVISVNTLIFSSKSFSPSAPPAVSWLTVYRGTQLLHIESNKNNRFLKVRAGWHFLSRRTLKVVFWTAEVKRSAVTYCIGEKVVLGRRLCLYNLYC